MKKWQYILLLPVLKIGAQPSLTFSIHNISVTSTITCKTPSIHFIAFSDHINGPLTCTWNSTGAQLTGTNVELGSPGIYTITAMAAGFQASSQTIAIGINTATPSSSLFPVSQSISCQGPAGEVTLTALSPTVGVTHIVATPYGGSFTVNSYSALYHPGGPGTYTHVIVDDVNGCTQSNTFTVSGGAGFPTFSLTSWRNFRLGCTYTNFDVVTFTNVISSNVPSLSVSYSIHGPPLTMGVNSCTINAAGTWTFVLNDNNNSCETRVPVSITKDTTAPTLFALVPFDIITCKNPMVILEGFTSNKTVSYLWTWPGMVGLSNQPTYTVHGKTSQPQATLVNTYTITITDNTNICRTYSAIPIYQNLYTPTLIAPAPFNVQCPDAQVIIYPYVAGITANCTYSWNYPTTATVIGIQSPSLTTTSPGFYTVAITNTINSCTASTQIAVEICAGLSDTETIMEMKVYPNPVIDKLQISFDKLDGVDVNLKINNALGQPVIFKQEIRENEEIDLGTFATGIYYLTLSQEGEGQRVFKVVKE